MQASALPHLPQTLRELPPFPAVALQALESLADSHTETRRIAAVVAADPVFASELMCLANSPLFSVEGRVRDLKHALVLVGRDRLRNLILATAVRALAKMALGKSGFRRWWQHSVATAVLADGLAQATRARFPQAYAAGLVHDIGRLALAVRAAETELAALDEARRRAGAQPGGEMQWERDLYGADHCQLGGRLLAEWGLPEELAQAAARHHQDGWKWGKDLLSHVRLACAVASHVGFAAVARRDDFERTLALVPNELRSRLPANPAAMAAALRIRLELTEDGDAEKLGGGPMA